MRKVLQIRNFAISLHSQLGRTPGCKVQNNAEIAQLVEHNLAKVGVASSSLVFRSQDDSLLVVVFLYLFISGFRPKRHRYSPFRGRGVNIVCENEDKPA